MEMPIVEVQIWKRESQEKIWPVGTEKTNARFKHSDNILERSVCFGKDVFHSTHRIHTLGRVQSRKEAKSVLIMIAQSRILFP